MPQDLRIAIRLDADAKGFRGEMRLGAKALAQLTGSADRASAASRRLARTTGQVEAAARRSGSAIGTIHRRVLQYGSALIGLHTATRATRGLLAQADTFTGVSNAVRLATASVEAHARVQAELFGIAHRSRTSITETAQLYQRLALSAKNLGASERDLLSVLEGVGQAVAISGSSSAAASGALLQLSQAFSGTVLQAQEYNSLIDGAPELLRVAARHMDGVGGSLGRLRERMLAGEITAREFFDAIKAGLPELQQAFDRSATKIGQALTQIDNAFTRTVGHADEAIGASTAISGRLTQAAERLGAFGAALQGLDTKRAQAALEDLGDAALIVAGTLGLRAVAGLTAWGARALWAAARAQRASIAATAYAAAVDNARLRSLAGARAARTFGGAVRFASIAVRGFNRAILRGPLGGALLVGYAAYEIYSAITSMRDAMDDATQSADEFRESLEGLNKVRLAALDLRISDQILGADKQLREAGERLEEARAEVERRRGLPRRPGRSGQAQRRADNAAERRAILAAEAHDIARERASALRRQQIDVLNRLAEPDAPGLPPGHPGARSGAGGGTSPDDANQQKRALDDLLAFKAAAEDRRARLTLGRIALVDRAEEQAIAKARALAQAAIEQAQGDATAIEAIEQHREEAITAARSTAEAERNNIRADALARELVAEQAHLERRQRLVENAATARAAVEQHLKSGRDTLATPWERATAAIERWEATARQAVATAREAAVAAASAGPDPALRAAAAAAEAEQNLTRITEIAAGRRADAWEREAERRLRASKRWQDGATRALRDIQARTEDYAALAERGIHNAFRAAADAITQFVRTGKLQFRDLVDNVIAGLTRIALERALVGALGGALDAFALFRLRGAGGGASDVHYLTGGAEQHYSTLHGGGIAGALGGVRRTGVPAAAFGGAPRLHGGGFASDELPAILRRGEGVFTPEQMAALSPRAPEVVVNIENRGTPQQARPAQQRWDGRRWIVGVVLDDLSHNGPISQGIQGRFAVPDRTG